MFLLLNKILRLLCFELNIFKRDKNRHMAMLFWCSYISGWTRRVCQISSCGKRFEMNFVLCVCVAAFCASVTGERVALPPITDLSGLTIEQLVAKASEKPGLEFLKDNVTLGALGIDPTSIHPDILEDSMLLTVIKFALRFAMDSPIYV